MSRAEDDDRLALAERVRRACVDAAVTSFEDARMAGLCAEGAWEVALGAVRGLDLEALLPAAPGRPGPDPTVPTR